MSRRLAEAFAPGSVAAQVAAVDWRAATRVAGELLVASGRTTPAYTQDIIQMLEELGPYQVIAPGIALVHARPSEAVLTTGLSLAVLEHPVEFGSKANDPVRLVFGLAAQHHDSHIEVLAEIANKLSNERFVNSLLTIHSESDFHRLLADS